MTTGSGLAYTASSEANQLVESKFNEARGYAVSSWALAQNYLTSLSSLIAHPSINTNISIPFNYSGGTIISSVLGDKPEAPTIDATISATKPTLGTMQALPAFSFLVGDIDTLRANILQKINGIVADGATGLDADVEALLWARARSRQEVENFRQYTEAEQFFSSRGFVLPTGALSGKLNEIAVEIARNNSYLNNDITVEQARLAQANTQFVYEKGAAIAIQMMTASIEGVVTANKNVVDVFAAQVEEFKQDIAGQIAVLEAVVKKYTAEAEVYKAVAYVASVDIDAQAKQLELSLKKAEVESSLLIKEAEIELDTAVKLHQLQVEAMKAGGQVTAQIAASALSAVNATASYGFSGGASISMGESYSWDETKGDESGMTTNTTHYFDETKSTVAG